MALIAAVHPDAAMPDALAEQVPGPVPAGLRRLLTAARAGVGFVARKYATAARLPAAQETLASPSRAPEDRVAACLPRGSHVQLCRRHDGGRTAVRRTGFRSVYALGRPPAVRGRTSASGTITRIFSRGVTWSTNCIVRERPRA